MDRSFVGSPSHHGSSFLIELQSWFIVGLLPDATAHQVLDSFLQNWVKIQNSTAGIKAMRQERKRPHDYTLGPLRTGKALLVKQKRERLD